MADKPVWTLDHIVDNITRENIAWLDPQVTYSFLNDVPANEDTDPAYQGFTPFDADQRAATVRVLSLYADVANITFVNGGDSANSNAKITYANSSTMPNFIHAWTASETGGSHAGGRDSIDASEIWIYSENITSQYEDGSFDFQVLLHETGHALGLSHPGDYNNNGQPITYEHDAEYTQDSQQYSVMSYFASSKTGANAHGEYGSTPLLHDVAAVQALYGANMATRAGNTVYGFHSTADRSAYDFTLTPRPVIAIWDGGGSDTIDLSGYSTDSHLDLNQGVFSDVAGLIGNLVICYGVTIENAVGGSGNDRIIGNAAGNIIRPGGGVDTVDGAGGNDSFVFTGAQFTAADVVHGGAGHDALYLTGDYSGGFVFANGTLASVEEIVCDGVFSYDLTLADGNVASGHTLTVDGSGLTGLRSLTVSGVAETNGRLVLLGGEGRDALVAGAGKDTVAGGAGNDVLAGGGAADTLRGDAGRDRFAYLAATDSTGHALDKIGGFDAAKDKFDLWFAVEGIDAGVGANRARDIAGALDDAHLGVHHAVLVTLTSGDRYLAIDANGIAGYQTGEDLLMNLADPSHLVRLDTGNFI